jgi:hydrogenase nickel incorporation protein HypA/HybF
LICLRECNSREYAEIMHEIRIASDLTDIVLAAAGKENLSKVTVVNVTFGQMVQIVPDVFESAFRFAVDGTVAADAELKIEIVPVKLHCRGCGVDFAVENNTFLCKNCGSSDIDITCGNELFIKSIEGDQI